MSLDLQRKSIIKFTTIFITTFIILSILTHAPEAQAVIMVNIRDEHGQVTTEGWWLINIAAPLFILSEIVKFLFGLLLLPFALFGLNLGPTLLAGVWANLTVMWPGLLVWGIFSVAGQSVQGGK